MHALPLGPAISTQSIVTVAKDKLSADLADEAVILDVQSGAYYGLDEVGALIWALIQEPKAVDEVCQVLLQQYDVEADSCERDLVAFLQELADQGLIEVQDVPAP